MASRNNSNKAAHSAHRSNNHNHNRCRLYLSLKLNFPTLYGSLERRHLVCSLTKNTHVKHSTDIYSDQKPILEQMKLVTEKWDPANPNCVFKYYFYNKVDESHVPYYKPQPHEDPREWEEALQNKPAPGFMPVLCSGYAGVADRLKTQKRAVSDFNTRLHQINGSLDAVLQRHELETEVRAVAARRRQTTISERCLALAARVQVLRNRGYALSGDEDDLSSRLQNLEREVQDPAVGAREEELWSRLIVLRGYADQLSKEMDKPSGIEEETIDPDREAKAKRVSQHLHHVDNTLLTPYLGTRGL